MDVLDLYARISLDTGDYERSLDGASKKGHGFIDTLKNGIGAAGKVAATGIAAATAAAGALTKASISGYGEYEQLAGGVETLFKTSADVVMNYANNAYKTAGLSANQYMETVTSFSASLLQSLGGDTAAAAKKADMAITDMADNANKMGTAIGSIQNAYQGFAKQNFTMLDNLKLGYGGTKEEMARLLKDAEKLSGIEYDISSYADIVDAIHVVQTEMGITGTTAAEAASTIQGSVAAAKSAWSNLVTGIADENADLDTLIGNFVDSVATAGENIVPRITKIISRIGSAAQEIAPVISAQIPSIVQSVLPPLVSAGGQLLAGIVEGIISAAPDLWDAAVAIVDELGNSLAEQIPGLSFVFENLETVVAAVTTAFIAFKAATAISGVINALTTATQGQTIAQTLLNAVMNANPFVLVATLIAGVTAAIITLWNTNDEFRGALTEIWESIKGVFSDAWEGIKGVFGGVGEFFSGVWSGIKSAFGSVADWFRTTFADAWKAVKNVFSAGGEIFEGIKEGILNGLKTVVNALITGINKVIAIPFNGINSALRSIKNVNIMGLTPFDWIREISIPQIPLLAKGAVIRPNNPFLAWLGDQKSGVNIETPLETMVQAFEKSLSEMEVVKIGFPDSAQGMASAAAINAMGGNASRPVFQLTANLVAPDGAAMAKWIANPLADYMDANGTPILNQT